MVTRTALVRRTKYALFQTRVMDLVDYLTEKDRVDILLYHGLCEGSQAPAGLGKLMPARTFEKHLEILTRRRKCLHLREAIEAGSGIVVTFDDGYANNYDLAFPILKNFNVPATIFVTTGFVDRTAVLWSDWLEFLMFNAPPRLTFFPWAGKTYALELDGPNGAARSIVMLKQLLRRMPVTEIHDFLRSLQAQLQLEYGIDVGPPLLRPLTWEQAQTMHASGLISFGAHTVSHPVLSRLHPDRQESEILESKQRLEQMLGEPCRTFAYPYGTAVDYNEITKEIVRSAGFEFAVSTRHGFNRPSACDVHEMRRWGADGTAAELGYLVSGGPSCLAVFGRRAN